MKKLIILFLALSVFAIPSRAQSVDASLSYSYFRLGGSGGLNQNGVSGSLAYNLKSWRWLGAVGDFGVYHASPLGVSLNTYSSRDASQPVQNQSLCAGPLWRLAPHDGIGRPHFQPVCL